MPKPTARKSRKSVKCRTIRKIQTNTRKTRKLNKKYKMNGGSEEEKTNNQIKTSCADYETDKESCLGNPVCDFQNNECITSYCTTKYGYNGVECIKNGCTIDNDTKLCVPSNQQITQRLQKAKTEAPKSPSGNLRFMMY